MLPPTTETIFSLASLATNNQSSVVRRGRLKAVIAGAKP
jgi:hypothetical protein